MSTPFSTHPVWGIKLFLCVMHTWQDMYGGQETVLLLHRASPEHWAQASGLQPYLTHVGLFLEAWLLSTWLCCVNTQFSCVYPPTFFVLLASSSDEQVFRNCIFEVSCFLVPLFWSHWGSASPLCSQLSHACLSSFLWMARLLPSSALTSYFIL